VRKHGARQAEQRVVHFAVRQQLVQQLGHVPQGDGPRVIYLRGQGRLHDFAGVQPGQLAPFALLPEGAHQGERLQGPAEALARLARRPRHAPHLAFGAGEERDQQVGLAQRVCSQHDGLGLLQRHGSLHPPTRRALHAED
jgi:hypothetical protein